jgi:putative serine/threonine protein kinase
MYEPFTRLCSLIKCPEGYVDRILNQLRELGVVELLSEGDLEFLGKLRLLGKGRSSFVFKCRVNNPEGYYACKVRRHDSTRQSLGNEALNLKLANGVGVGPLLIRYTNDVLVMEYARGVRLDAYLSSASDQGIRAVVRELLVQGFKLDSIGLVHSELTRPHRHVIVGDRVYIIDFESASRATRSVTNVTQLVNALILSGGSTQRRIREILNLTDADGLIRLLRVYKDDVSRESLNAILRLLGLAELS